MEDEYKQPFFMKDKPEKLPLKGTSPASMSSAKEKYAKKQQGLTVRQEMMGTPTSLATSMAKLMSPSAMMQVTGSELRHHEITISLNSGLVVAFIPSIISLNPAPVRGRSNGNPSEIVWKRKPG